MRRGRGEEEPSSAQNVSPPPDTLSSRYPGASAAAGPAEIMTGNTAVIVVTRPAIPSRASGEGLCDRLLWAALSHMLCAIMNPPRAGATDPDALRHDMGGGVPTGSTVHPQPTVRNPKHYCLTNPP